MPLSNGMIKALYKINISNKINVSESLGTCNHKHHLKRPVWTWCSYAKKVVTDYGRKSQQHSGTNTNGTGTTSIAYVNQQDL